MKHGTVELTKAYEKAMFDRIVRETPEGYVKTILADVQLEVERAIDSDFGFISFKERMTEIEGHRTAMIAGRLELQNLKNQISELHRTRIQLETGLELLRNKAQAFARL